ncbi:PrpF domain-containing protein [Streptomyces shenzhenensis]|uniref:Uncharacterized protein n=1 Tax=Streptomyces shenzhenensis TaxID=943815 RepID=A0A3M0I6E3_9ACTN|nr:PrpF domain-containing protein [Streptomyces shenzhenensis]RMB82333.1 hypothetical protein CTZ28_29805 [Streptomyces shenzhenensis]
MRAYWVTGAVCTAVAARLPGSVPNEAATRAVSGGLFRVRHPAGALDVEADVDGTTPKVRRAAQPQTARRLMDGVVRLPAG